MELRNRIPVLIRYLVIVIMTWLIMPGIAAGQYRVGGTIVDAHDGSPLSGATVVLTHKSTSPPKAVVSLREGQFGFDGVAAGEYELSVKFLGYEELRKGVKVDTGEVRLGRIALRPVSKELDEIDARATMIRQEQRGDTTVFNAAAFKVSPDATTEDLLKKMPGMQVKDGTVKHAGEEIKKVLVDGKEFFSSDPSIALRNIDASLVDKIEVFDKQSEQSEFTGISDGNEERTLNILTKSRFMGGSFGQAYGGVGTDWHYETGFTSNTIHDGNRLSVIAQINDIGQRGLAPVSTTTPSSGKYTAALCAINTSISRNPKLNFDAGFSFNLTKTGNHSNSLQEYLVKDDNEEPRIYESETYSDNNNKDHHLNTRIHWKIDSLNTIDFKPDISWQRNEAYNDNAGQDTRGQDTLRTTSRRSNNSTEKLTLRGSLTINHKFLKPRRTISLRHIREKPERHGHREPKQPIWLRNNPQHDGTKIGQRQPIAQRQRDIGLHRATGQTTVADALVHSTAELQPIGQDCRGRHAHGDGIGRTVKLPILAHPQQQQREPLHYAPPEPDLNVHRTQQNDRLNRLWNPEIDT